MDESANQENAADVAARKARMIKGVRVCASGFDTWLPANDVKSALRKHFSRCGDILSVSINRTGTITLNKYAMIYIRGGDDEEKAALQLSGTKIMGGRKLFVKALEYQPLEVANITGEPLIPLTYKFPHELVASLAEAKRLQSRIIVSVTGHDMSLPKDDIKRELANHFSSCGEILGVFPCVAPHTKAFILILGEGTEEKVLQLNGSDMGGCKLVVEPYTPPGKDSVPASSLRGGYSHQLLKSNPTNKKKKQTKKMNHWKTDEP